jgi:hypothetical protein
MRPVQQIPRLGYDRHVIRRLLPMAILFGVVALPAQAHFPSAIDLSVPPGGEGWITSPAMPPAAGGMDVFVRRMKEKEEDENADVFLRIALVLQGQPNRHARFLTCGAIAGDALGNAVATGDEEGVSIGLVFLKLCTLIARKLPDKKTGSAAASASSCGIVRKTVGIKITRSGKTWRGTITSNPSKTKRPPVVASCTRTAGGYAIKVRARSRRKKLRQVVGPTLGIGVLSTGNGFTAKTTFKVH